jgi:DNA-binding response OmpR family regulator
MRKKIILVEDTSDLRSNIAELLTMEKYEVFEATNGAEALAILERIIPDLIITDLLMPIMDGFELIKNVRDNTKYKYVAILVFSATPANESEKKVLELGANAYLKKPSTLENFTSSVNKLIGK